MDVSPRKRKKLCVSSGVTKNGQLIDIVEDGNGEDLRELNADSSPVSQDQSAVKTRVLPDDSSLSDDDNLSENELDRDDPFALHFESEISDTLVQNIEKKLTEHAVLTLDVLKSVRFMKYCGSSPPTTSLKDLNSLHIKPELISSIPGAQAACRRVKETQTVNNDLSVFQKELLSIIGNYHDLLYSDRTFDNGEEIRLSYCLHALNHILKTRSRVVHHNRKLSKSSDKSLEYRDQGFTRPKVLILVPFKEAALRVVNLLIRLLTPDKKGNVLNKKRFMTDFMSHEETPQAKVSRRPDDFESTFSGNIEDAFRLGITITRRSMKLYADFYSSDIIIASPLGIRTVIGAEGEKNRDYDFLASIEVLILDQADVFLMQNWEHVLHMLQHMHQQPTQARNTDFSRVRMWSLNDWSKHYRQTLVFGSIAHPLLTAVFNRCCTNFAGRYVTLNAPLPTALSQVLLQVPQVFHRYEPQSLESLPEDRLKFFLSRVLCHFKDPVMSHTMIYIPSYFDYVRIRNHFRKEEISFTQICEYSKEGKVARARDMFFHGQKHFLLFTERFHFYHRYMIKGVRHVIFYELPTYPHFYSEIANLLHPRFQAKQRPADNSSVAVLYSKYEAQQLIGVVGQDRARTMLTSDKKVHMFVTER